MSALPKVVLVRLTDAQIARAKETNGARKRITHAVVCPGFGQRYGTEKQCRPYFDAWSEIFPMLFSGGVETADYALTDFATTFELVNHLFAADDAARRAALTGVAVPVDRVEGRIAVDDGASRAGTAPPGPLGTPTVREAHPPSEPSSSLLRRLLTMLLG